MAPDMSRFHELRPTTAGRGADRGFQDRHFRNDSLSRLVPLPSPSAAITAARAAINQEDEFERPNGHRRSLSEGSNTVLLRAAPPSVDEVEIDVFTTIPPVAMPDLGTIGSQPDSPPPRNKGRTKTRLPVADAPPVPKQHSYGRNSLPVSRTRNAEKSPARHGPRPEEIEAASKILAEAEWAGFNSPRRARRMSPESERSATPPPIGRRGRARNTIDGVSGFNEPQPQPQSQSQPLSQPLSQPQHQHQQVPKVSTPPPRPPRPSADDDPFSNPKSRPQSSGHRSSSTQHSRRVPLAYDRGVEPRTPVLDQLQLAPDQLLTPEAGQTTRPASSRKQEINDGNGSYRQKRGPFSRQASSTTEPELANLAVGGSLVPDIVEEADHQSTHSHTRTMRRRPFSDDGLSDSRNSSAVRRQLAGNGSASRLPDFFSYEIFQIVLRDPATAHRLHQFSQTRCCGENIEFLTKVDDYHKQLGELASTLALIHKSFISDQSTSQLDLPIALMNSVHKEMRSVLGTSFVGLESIFHETRSRIEDLVFSGVYPSFVRFQLTLSATRALANDRHRYQGLGDCFCLTDPNKADNPIVFASDGFVKVTGYTRPEIIPRNCRFLQGMQTDRVPVQRLKKGITSCRETVELLLNYRKNGDPFWNLLYVAPLFDKNGNVAFFLGGQVNCSTTIHNNADAMRVLSTSSVEEAGEDAPRPPPTLNRQSSLPSARRALLKAFGMRVDPPKGGGAAVQGAAGMEREVLGRMEGQTSEGQVREFYTAYSKYLVVEAASFAIQFHSEGVTDVLNPANNEGLLAGLDVFRFFKRNMVGKETDYRARVRNAIRNGQPISVEIRLQTRRSAKFRGDERFVAHWTPVKDENAASHWVVVTLAPTIL